MMLTRWLCSGLIGIVMSGCGGDGGGSGESDATPPSVASTSPTPSATGIAIDGALSVSFSEPMAAGSIGAASFTLSQGGSAVSGTVSYSGTTATFTPAAPLAPSTTYTATLTAGATDSAGNPLPASYVWSFTTADPVAGGADTTPPTVASTSPPDGADDVAIDAAINAVFSEAMAGASFDITRFRLRAEGSGSEVAGAVAAAGNTATFTAAAPLIDATSYTATIIGGVTDTAGNALGADHVWRFTTAGPASVLTDTGIAANQCYLAGSSALGPCTSDGARALGSQQDGMRGRDVNMPDSTDGKLGFRYSAVGSFDATECVRDGITGLMWEGKAAAGLRVAGGTYTNYDSTTALQKLTNSGYVAPTSGEISAASNSVGYASAVNATALCGFSDWRLPNPEELLSLMDYGVEGPNPTIDATWFPNTQRNYYWSSLPDAGATDGAWGASFHDGSAGSSGRGNRSHVRLVRVDR